MRVGVIDDESPSRQVIINILKKFCPYATVVAQEGSVSKAVNALNETQPDVVFLDIELKGGNGFDVLKDLNFSPMVIFTTAYSQYAINAIKVRAFDYLLKPINENELVNSLEKCKLSLDQKTKPKEKSEPDNGFFNFNSSDGKHAIRFADILYFESSGAYTYCVTAKEKMLLSKNLGEIERELPSALFFRTHHSYIVNLNKIVKAELKRSGTVFLEQEHTVPVAQRKIKEFKQYLSEGTDLDDED